MEVSWPLGRNKSMKRMVGLGMLMERREVLSLHSVAYAEDGAAVWLTYKLLEAGGRYGVLCYREGVEQAGRPWAAAAVEDVFCSREQAEGVLRRLAGRQVAPAHLADVIWEM